MVVKEIRRATRRQFSAEEKIRIVLTGLRGVSGGAVARASRALRDKLCRIGAHLLQCEVSETRCEGGAVHGPHGSVTIAEIASAHGRCHGNGLARDGSIGPDMPQLSYRR